MSNSLAYKLRATYSGLEEEDAAALLLEDRSTATSTSPVRHEKRVSSASIADASFDVFCGLILGLNRRVANLRRTATTELITCMTGL